MKQKPDYRPRQRLTTPKISKGIASSSDLILKLGKI